MCFLSFLYVLSTVLSKWCLQFLYPLFEKLWFTGFFYLSVHPSNLMKLPLYWHHCIEICYCFMSEYCTVWQSCNIQIHGSSTSCLQSTLKIKLELLQVFIIVIFKELTKVNLPYSKHNDLFLVSCQHFSHCNRVLISCLNNFLFSKYTSMFYNRLWSCMKFFVSFLQGTTNNSFLKFFIRLHISML